MLFRLNFWMSSSRADCTERHLGRKYGLRIALPHSYLIDRFDTLLGKSTNPRTPPEKLAGSIMQSRSSKNLWWTFDHSRNSSIATINALFSLRIHNGISPKLWRVVVHGRQVAIANRQKIVQSSSSRSAHNIPRFISIDEPSGWLVLLILWYSRTFTDWRTGLVFLYTWRRKRAMETSEEPEKQFNSKLNCLVRHFTESRAWVLHQTNL